MNIQKQKLSYNAITPKLLQEIEKLNENKQPQQIYIVGVDTECCVLITATSLFERDIRPIVLTQYCSSNGGEESHKAGLISMRRLIGEKQLVDKVIDRKTDLENI